MEQNRVWQSYGEYNNSDAYKASLENEFKDNGNTLETDASLFKAPASRRDFLKYLGFSTAAAAIAASCEIPVKKAIPFANKPEDIVPGIANYYATTYVQDGESVSVLAKVRDGRPIKIEGNDLSVITKGGTSAKVQASVLDLYDNFRITSPQINNKKATIQEIDKAIVSELESLKGKPTVLLTSTLVSPTTKEIINQITQKNPNFRHVTYDAVSYSSILEANQLTFGKQLIPSYHFDKADVIVSLGADFLGTWLSPVEFNKQYAVGKKLDEKAPKMVKHFHFDSVPTLTSCNADERFLHKPSQSGVVVNAIWDAINGKSITGISDNETDKELKKGIQKVAKELLENRGKALVVSGSSDVNEQLLVNAINNLLISYGSTIDWSETYPYTALDSDFSKLVDELNNGTIATLLIHASNPAYSWFESEKFVNGLKKVTCSITFNPKRDETFQNVKYAIPDNHYLESWGDAEPKTGHISFLQPTINPLYETRQWQDSLMKFFGIDGGYTTFLKTYWSAKLGGEMGWEKALQDGVITPATTTTPQPTFIQTALSVASSALLQSANSGSKGKIELQLYQKVAIGYGQGTANPWLQEMPDPISKATWDNYVIVSPSLAKTLLNIDVTNNGQADSYEVQPPKKVVEVEYKGKKIALPALIIPGTHPETIGIALGYGRNKELGTAVVSQEGEPVGANVFPFTSILGNNVSFKASDVKITLTSTLYKVGLTQTHNTYNTAQGNRVEVMKELTLSEFKHSPDDIRKDRENELAPFGGIKKYEEQGTIYPTYDRPGIKWGLSIDLNTCTGCSACVIACTAENNVPVVGKPEVIRAHEMHWLRIDRYYSGNDLNNPKVVFQPLMCQHCDNAPCENVCPVAATNHSSEGLNQMTYNRCIGTRYCANNCPYKVRRFNWADYTGADSFEDNQREVLSEVVMYMNDDVTRMVLNPDVTVRSRGVIEKCSFCVQRLQAGKLKAKKDSRPLEDSDIQVACQQACPTNAIVFGNANSTKSAVTAHRRDNPNRLFLSLEQLHVLPNVTYLAKVRNIDEA